MLPCALYVYYAQQTKLHCVTRVFNVP